MSALDDSIDEYSYCHRMATRSPVQNDGESTGFHISARICAVDSDGEFCMRL
jgi:hypothetical protein